VSPCWQSCSARRSPSRGAGVCLVGGQASVCRAFPSTRPIRLGVTPYRLTGSSLRPSRPPRTRMCLRSGIHACADHRCANPVPNRIAKVALAAAKGQRTKVQVAERFSRMKQDPPSMALPDFHDDGRLPDGLRPATESEVTFRFGSAKLRRRRLALRLRRWIARASAVHAKRFLVDGSFVTVTPDPQDVDAVVWHEGDLSTRVSRGDVEAVGLEMMLLTRQPEESYAAGTQRDWEDWVENFSLTPEADGRRKGLVEVDM
jgi:hypothetical protein